MADSRYTPKPGSLSYRVLTFMVLNPDEELTRADIAAKFDASHSTIDSLLALPVSRGVLKRGRNSDMDLVWSLGDSSDFVLDQSQADEEKVPTLPARCFPGTRQPSNQEDSYMVRPTTSASKQMASPFPTAPPVILNLDDIKVRKGVKLLTKEERRRAEFADWFKQFDVGDSAEFDDIHFSTIKTECIRHMRATETKFRFAETGPGRQGLERIA